MLETVAQIVPVQGVGPAVKVVDLPLVGLKNPAGLILLATVQTGVTLGLEDVALLHSALRFWAAPVLIETDGGSMAAVSVSEVSLSFFDMQETSPAIARHRMKSNLFLIKQTCFKLYH